MTTKEELDHLIAGVKYENDQLEKARDAVLLAKKNYDEALNTFINTQHRQMIALGRLQDAQFGA